MYIQHDLCQFWCFYHQTHNFFHKSAALSLTLTITHAQARRCGVDVRSRRRCHCTTAATSRVPTTRTSTTRTSGQVLHLDAMSPTNYPDKYYTEIRTSGQVLHMYAASPNYPDKYYMDAECRSVVYQCMSLRTMNIISKYLLLIGRIATRSARRGLLMQTQ